MLVKGSANKASAAAAHREASVPVKVPTPFRLYAQAKQAEFKMAHPSMKPAELNKVRQTSPVGGVARPLSFVCVYPSTCVDIFLVKAPLPHWKFVS